MSRTFLFDTIVALATPPMGRSALAVLRVSGSDCLAIVGQMLRDPSDLYSAVGHSSLYVSLLDGGGEEMDDVVLGVFRAPRSYTGEDVVEITCHGSAIISSAILSRLCELGARMAEPGEFSQRAFLAGKLSIEDAEIIDTKVNAQSPGGLRGRVLAIHEKYVRLEKLYDGLISLLAQVDAEIDFGESDNIQISGFEEKVDSLREELSVMLRRSSGRTANDGYFSVVLTGPPNVGKSSLFNSILDFERSIVSPVPGTTRDYVEHFVELHGFRVKIVDTAGIRQGSDATEARGIELGMTASRRADLVLRVTDPLDRAPELGGADALIHNKVDLDGWRDGICVSALTGVGVSALVGFIEQEMGSTHASANQSLIHDSERLVLEEVAAKLETVDLIREPSLIAEDIRLSVVRLGELLGLNVGADSLDYVFSRMCIGK